MGGCAISCMSMIDSAKQAENPHMTAIKTLGKQSIEIGSNDGKPESRIRRSPSMANMTLDDIYKNFYGGKHGTLAIALEETCRKLGSARAMSYRPIEKTQKEELTEGEKTKMWEYIYLKPTVHISYQEMWQKMIAFGEGLAEDVGLPAGSRVGLYEDTRYEWMVACYGIWSRKMVGVTVYANLGDDALVYAIKEAELPAMFLNGKLVANLIKLCKKAGVKVPKLIVTDAVPAGVDTEGAEIFNFDELVAKHAQAKTPELPANPKDLALIMYTSGTTGDPKGVMMSHGNVYAAVFGLRRRLDQVLGEPATDIAPEEQDTHLAYLPLAHILEFCAENILLIRGATLGYGTPRTLTDTSAKPHGDLKEFKPTFFVGVPRIFDTIKKAVEGKLPAKGEFRRRVFDRAYEERKAALAQGYDTPYWNDRVFANPRALLGGRCRMIISGGAPMSSGTYEFLSVVFGCAVGQGYGLTETCAGLSIQRYYDLQKENVGGLLSVCEVKLRDVDPWKHTDQPHPRGEVLMRGPTVTQGYYNQPEKTKEAFLDDGWFATGDVGMFAADGTLKIVGRTKALAKNSHGEYIAMESLESLLVQNELAMPNGVCILVESQEAFICALVLTDEQKAMKFAAENKISGTWPEILETKEFKKAAIASLGATAKAAGRKPFEMVKNVAVLADEWTPENGILTAASKLRRSEVDKKYKDTIAKLFKEV